MKRILFGVACAAHRSGKVKGKARFGRTVTRILVSIVSLPIFTARAEMPEGYRRVWNDEVRAQANERIEKHRKADAVVDGLPVGVEVQVRQQTHAFKFGAHIFNFDQLGRDDWNETYRATFTNLFNAATVAYFWKYYEPVQGEFRHAAGPRDSSAFWKSVSNLTAKQKHEKYIEYRRPAPDPVLDFCAANGVDAHGHAMIYRIAQPDWVTNVAPTHAGQIDIYRRHIRELAAHVGTRVSQWDVVNESVRRESTVAAPDDTVFWQPQWGFGVPPDYTISCYQEAEKALPRGVLSAINDACTIDSLYFSFIKALLKRGARIDVVGVQFHIFKAQEMVDLANGAHKGRRNYCYSPERILRTLSEADDLGRPIHISEITIPAPEESAWGEEVQAAVLCDLYRLWFSWPSVYRITYWNLVDFTYHKESLASGFYRRDMQKKAVYHAIDRLLNHEWKTRLTKKVNAEGKLLFRGFRGRYRLTWKDESGATVSRNYELK